MDHQAFTDTNGLKEHYKQIRKNLEKNVYVPRPKVQEPEPVRKVIEVERKPTILVSPELLKAYEESMAGLRNSGKQGRANKVTMRDIVKEVAEKNGFNPDDLMLRSRRMKLIKARHEAFYRMRHELNMSYPRIAAFFDMDHTTVMHGIFKHRDKLEEENKNG